MQTIIFLDNSLTFTTDFDYHIAKVYEITHHLNILSDMLEFSNTVNSVLNSPPSSVGRTRLTPPSVGLADSVGLIIVN